MSEAEMNSYRLTSMEEPGDDRLAQIMREVAEDARQETQFIKDKVASGIEAAAQTARNQITATLKRLSNGGN